MLTEENNSEGKGRNNVVFCDCSTAVTQGAPLCCRSVNTSSYATASEHGFSGREAEGGVRRRSGLSSC